MGTPGEKEKSTDEPKEVTPAQATLYRACVARGIYMTQDRSDIQYAVKELSRAMSNPTSQDMSRLRRLGRFLKGKPRVVTELGYRTAKVDGTINIDVYTDTDFAGCARTRKSTSGGIIKVNGHTVKMWSTTQNVIAVSSGEAEYYGLVKGASQAIGIRSMLKDLGITDPLSITLKTDASAAVGIASRRGMGKVRHIEVNQLWLQQKVHHKEVTVVKINGADNPAAHLTKYLDIKGIRSHMAHTSQSHVEGRHSIAPGTIS